jgi:GntR family transcriptional regulator, carbon starvation induced regulator
MAIPQAVPEPKKRRVQSAATLASVVYEQLRADLLRGTLAPGEKLRMESLRQRYGVGASPLREALNRLAAEGLVMQIDQRGFRVAPVSIEDLRELTKARLWVTGLALRESIAHGDAAWEERIVLAFHRMMRAVGRSPDGTAVIGAAGEKLHAAFHAALIDACGSRWITDFAAMLFDCARRYQHLSTQWKHQPRDIAAEHRTIMDAVLARDAELAVKLHDAHIARTVEIVADMAGHSDTNHPATPARRPK